MIRMTLAETTPPVLKLEGRLTGPSLAEFDRVCGEVLAGSPLHLDLTDLLFVDEAGVEAIRRQKRRGATAAGCSPFLRELFKETPG